MNPIKALCQAILVFIQKRKHCLGGPMMCKIQILVTIAIALYMILVFGIGALFILLDVTPVERAIDLGISILLGLLTMMLSPVIFNILYYFVCCKYNKKKVEQPSASEANAPSAPIQQAVEMNQKQ